MVDWLHLLIASVNALSLYWATVALLDISDSLRAMTQRPIDF